MFLLNNHSVKSVDDYREHVNEDPEFIIYDEDDVRLLHEIMDEFGIIPKVEGLIDEYLDILRPNMRVNFQSALSIPGALTKFDKLRHDGAMDYEEYEKDEQLSKLDRAILEKIEGLDVMVNRASQIKKLGYLPGVCIGVDDEFKFDCDLSGTKVGILDTSCCYNTNISTKFLRKLESIDTFNIETDAIEHIPNNAKIKNVRICWGRGSVYEDNGKDCQNLADNPNIVSIHSTAKLVGDFSQNTTLMDYSGPDNFGEIAAQNRANLAKSRFAKTKPVLN